VIVHNLEEHHSIVNQFIAEIRDADIQKDSMRFRRNIERIGEVLSYELSKSLMYTTKKVQTPLGNKEIQCIKEQLVLCSILRAGIPLHQGVLNYFDNAENAFISAYRNHSNNDDFEIITKYLASPSIEGKTVLLIDPMLATGKTLEVTYNAMKNYGTAQQIHILSVIGSTEGVNYIKKHFPENTHLWIAAIDNELNSKGYIIPGLGDAGDLAYGVKL